MMSGLSRKLIAVVFLTALFVVWPPKSASGFTPETRPVEPMPQDEARTRLVAGFWQILQLFEQRDFSLLTAWSQMRESADPAFFEKTYPGIASELDGWSASFERRFEVDDRGMDLSFIAETFSPVVLDGKASDVMRDNALATICMVCVMDSLRCDPHVFHRLLSTVVADDPSALRKAEALRWWRRSGGVIDEGLLETVLISSGRTDLALRTEIARTLFSLTTRRSLSAQRHLSSTSGLPDDPSGGQAQIACTALRHFASERFSEAVPDVRAALGDPSAQVRECAAETLASLTGRHAAPGSGTAAR